MSVFKDIKVDGTHSAGADLISEFRKFVKLNSSGLVVPITSVTDVPFGILANKPVSGKSADVIVLANSTAVVAGEPLSLNDPIGFNENGQAVLADNVEWQVGRARRAVDAAGQALEIMVDAEKALRSPAYNANAWGFSAANTHFSRGSGDLHNGTGIADVYVGTFSLWFQYSDNGTAQYMWSWNDSSGGVCNVHITAGDILRIEVAPNGGVNFRFASTATIADTNWHHILSSWDMTNPLTTTHFYLDDSPLAGSFNFGPTTNVLTNWTPDTAVVGAQGTAGTNDWVGCLSEIWLDPTYFDLTVEANRRKFITAGGKPAKVGANGQLPKGGTTPFVYLNGPPATVHLNKGFGNDYNAPVVTPGVCATGPSD